MNLRNLDVGLALDVDVSLHLTLGGGSKCATCGCEVGWRAWKEQDPGRRQPSACVLVSKS